MTQGALSEITYSGFNGCYYRLTADDDFRVDGPPSGASVSLVLRLDAHYETYGWNGGEGHVTIAVPIAGTKKWDLQPSPVPPNLDVSEDSSLTLGIVAQAGVPFHVSFDLWTGAYGETDAEMLGQYHFDGLPAGAVISSCRGYSQGSVRTMSTTWGRLRASYR